LIEALLGVRTFLEMTLVTTKEAAQILGVTPVRVRQLIKEKRLAAEKHGRDHLLQDREVERFKRHGRRSGPKGGRPPRIGS
jgi:excisionase family DNA binding protein